MQNSIGKFSHQNTFINKDHHVLSSPECTRNNVKKERAKECHALIEISSQYYIPVVAHEDIERTNPDENY